MSRIQLTSLSNRSAAPVLDTHQLIYVLTEIRPSQGMANHRLPLNLTLLLDRSGSMSGPKLRNLKEAVKRIIDQLGSEDLISIVTFETRPQVLIPIQPASDKHGIKKVIDSIDEGGGTNMALALREGIRQAKQKMELDRTSRLVLLTDGEATDKVEYSYHEADLAGKIKLPIVGLGLGKDWNEDFISDIADRSINAPGSRAGHVDYIKDPDDVTKIFQEVYDSMQVIAQDTTLNIRMAQGLEALRVWQVSPLINDMGDRSIQGRTIMIDIGELEQSGTSYLVEMTLPPRPEGIVRVAQTEFNYSLLDQSSNRAVVDLIVKFSIDPAEYKQTDERVVGVVERVQAYKLQTQALREVEEGRAGQATQKLRQAVTLLLSQGDEKLAEQIQQEVEQLEEFGEISSKGKKTIKFSSRKTMKF